ncbi:HVO_A0114 family putative DNA-binding protein [Vibrio cholerae]|uniref:HVO_A0114 family putative DNA-binding protein n=1 Tax=Vibrio cholerae TaxID=666 RepID=UPI000D5CFBFB|nr:helix-turn-helix domain-containing protein [Vibrio cholerae]EII3002035.1 helix-turn-helix domain-containing protein [Vibrio cholerae]EII3727409.1 helix-turn-helix domain-containing protein [Vibrio cholerae]EJB8349056.1 helix-turn-helix domain-containing protein [Vibrio cholerae]EJB8378366.1 helix-turn-helix domain-containing protein [Vibrio cholerae]MDX5050169.1 helix-turn-helix domain-containing protein [Vibrio cholerae]
MDIAKQKRCVIGIRGQISDPDYPVDIWFDSLKSVANVLSKENQYLLKVIAEQQPQSVTELANLTGRAVSNVSRTLKTLDCLGIVCLVRISGQVKPSTKFRSFIVVGDYYE